MARPPTLSDRVAAREPPSGAPLARKQLVKRLLLHWAWDASAVQRGLPSGLTVDTFKGRAWVGISVSAIRGVVPAFLPSVLSVWDLRSISVRTYAFDRFSRPGVAILKADFDSWIAVTVGRWIFDMACDRARIGYDESIDQTVDATVRMHHPPASSRFSWRPGGEPQQASLESETLEAFLLERYRLFSMDRREMSLNSAALFHPPMNHQSVELTHWDDAALRRIGLDRSGRAPEHVCCATAAYEHLYAMSQLPEADPIIAPEAFEDNAMPA